MCEKCEPISSLGVGHSTGQSKTFLPGVPQLDVGSLLCFLAVSTFYRYSHDYDSVSRFVRQVVFRKEWRTYVYDQPEQSRLDGQE